MFNVFSVLFAVVFVFVMGVFIAVAVRGISQWSKNNHPPRLTVEAKVISKRTNYRRSSGSGIRMGHTTYYVTFEVGSGDRMELQMQGSEYALLVEGDFGELTFQGTRYQGFARKNVCNDVYPPPIKGTQQHKAKECYYEKRTKIYDLHQQ